MCDDVVAEQDSPARRLRKWLSGTYPAQGKVSVGWKIQRHQA